jgi:hypothetical protein
VTNRTEHDARAPIRLWRHLEPFELERDILYCADDADEDALDLTLGVDNQIVDVADLRFIRRINNGIPKLRGENRVRLLRGDLAL